MNTVQATTTALECFFCAVSRIAGNLRDFWELPQPILKHSKRMDLVGNTFAFARTNGYLFNCKSNRIFGSIRFRFVSFFTNIKSDYLHWAMACGGQESQSSGSIHPEAQPHPGCKVWFRRGIITKWLKWPRFRLDELWYFSTYTVIYTDSIACWSRTRPICSNLLRCATICCHARCRSWFPDSLWSWHDYQCKVVPQCQWLSWLLWSNIVITRVSETFWPFCQIDWSRTMLSWWNCSWLWYGGFLK